MRGVRRAAGPAAWLVSTAVATAIAWWAVTAVGAREDPGAVLSEGQVSAQLADERAALAAATSTPTPTTTGGPTPSVTPTASPTTPPDVTAVVRTWSVTGGVVSVSCSGDVASLVYATPSSGWRVDAKERGPGDRVRVELEREGTETYVEAVCVDGTPTHTVAGDDSGGSHDDSDERTTEDD